MDELVNLKKDSLDVERQLLTLMNVQGEKRQHRVTSRCIQLFQDAVYQTKYLLNNGYSSSRQASVNLKNSDYLIKISLQDFVANESMITEMDSVVLRAIYMRLRKLAEFFSSPELTYLTTVKLELKEMAYA